MKKKDIEALTGLPDNVKADLFALVTSVEEKDQKISDLTKKAEDSDRVVAKNSDLEKLVRDRDQEKAGLMARLEALTNRPAGTLREFELTAFKPFFEMFGDDPDDENPDPV